LFIITIITSATLSSQWTIALTPLFDRRICLTNPQETILTDLADFVCHQRQRIRPYVLHVCSDQRKNLFHHIFSYMCHSLTYFRHPRESSPFFRQGVSIWIWIPQDKNRARYCCRQNVLSSHSINQIIFGSSSSPFNAA